MQYLTFRKLIGPLGPDVRLSRIFGVQSAQVPGGGSKPGRQVSRVRQNRARYTPRPCANCLCPWPCSRFSAISGLRVRRQSAHKELHAEGTRLCAGEKRVSLTATEAKISAWIQHCNFIDERSLAMKFKDPERTIIEKPAQWLLGLDMVEPL